MAGLDASSAADTGTGDCRFLFRQRQQTGGTGQQRQIQGGYRYAGKRVTQDHPRGIGGQTACQQNLANAYAERDAQILRGGHGVTCYRDHTVAVTFAVRHRPV